MKITQLAETFRGEVDDPLYDDDPRHQGIPVEMPIEKNKAFRDFQSQATSRRA